VSQGRVTQRFPIRVGKRSRPLLLLFGVRAGNAWVELDGVITARFGFYRLSTPLENLASYQIEGPWLWLTAIGVRRSWRGGDLTFAGSPHGGVRLNFMRPVRLGPLRVPALYVTVDDLDGFATALAARGVPGQDARKRKVR
jgi:hypothetical protein